ncbi:MAG: hypothetical protein JEZ08_17525 [Clostridiales bacterium]|nr:hypothetical protein [Clostridiales bacterium]
MIGIVFINDIKLCPYLSKYTDALEALALDYEIIYWNRTEKNESYPNNHHVLSLPSKEELHPVLKIKAFIKFSIFAKKIIRKKKYDKLVILTTLTGMCMYKMLLKEYKNRYVLDYRDASYEYITVFKNRLEKLIENAYFTCISSKGFLDILPRNTEYVIAHNFKYDELENRVGLGSKSNSEVIKVCYIGLLREKKYLENLVDTFGNDSRFEMVFHGNGEWLESTKNYAKGIENISFTGGFRSEEKKGFIEASDMMCFNYVSNFNNDKLIANKFYDALIYKKPLIGNIEIFSGHLIEKHAIGISLHYNEENFLDKIYEYYQKLDMEQYSLNAEKMLDRILKEDQIYIEKINEFLKE